jgi:hypothetical protein
VVEEHNLRIEKPTFSERVHPDELLFSSNIICGARDLTRDFAFAIRTGFDCHLTRRVASAIEAG